jgi:hypothetical protein
MAGTPYALNYLAPQARDAARDDAAQLADYEEWKENARREDRDAENRWDRWAGCWDLDD